MGRRPAATGDSAPAGGLSSGDAPPISLLSCQKRNGPCTVQREKRWRAPVQWPSARTGVGVPVPAPIWPCLRARYALLRFLLLPSRGGWRRPRRGGCRMELLLFSLPLTLPRRIRQRVAQRNARKEKLVECILAPRRCRHHPPRDSSHDLAEDDSVPEGKPKSALAPIRRPPSRGGANAPERV